MKKQIVILALMLVLLLSGCAQELPAQDADGNPWQESWVSLGNVVGVEPMEGWSTQRNEDVLAPEGIYFASWYYGEGEENDAGETVFPAQIFLVLNECESEDALQTVLSEWQALAQERYLTEEMSAAGDYTMMRYRFPENSGNFDLGAVAYGRHGLYAVNAEISCRDDFPGDPAQVLTEFLGRFHYAK